MKPCILVFAEVYLPGYLAGGPVRSLANLIACLGEEFRWKVITTDRDFHAKAPYADVQPDQWARVGAAEVYYASPQSLAPRKMLRLIADTPHDLLYLNSFFSPRFSILPMLARRFGALPRHPALIAPRGEFSAGAYLLKRWKKKPFVRFTRMIGVYEGAHWHASTELEAGDVCRVMGAPQQRIHLARNIARSNLRDADVAADEWGTALRVSFLSRISRMKNLDFALQVLAKVERPVVFTVYGPKEDSQYWAECERLVRELPAHITFKYAGALPNERVRDELAKHDLFFLPTRGENYGHVLVEAWSAGLPVLTSDQTPWRELEVRGVGWDLPLNDQVRFVQIIDDFVSWPTQRRRELRQRCSAFGIEITRDEGAVEASRAMFWTLYKEVSGAALQQQA